MTEVEQLKEQLRNSALLARVAALEIAGRKALSALDKLMGDSDLDSDDSEEMQACKAISDALSGATENAMVDRDKRLRDFLLLINRCCNDEADWDCIDGNQVQNFLKEI